MIAASNVKGEYDVHVFDSLCGSLGMGYMCREARELERAGKSVAEISARLEQIRASASLIITLATLKYAQMSGRVGGLRGMLGMMLNLKPIIQLTDGFLLPTEDKVRVRSKAFERITELSKERLGNAPIRLGVVHANCPDEAKTLAALARKEFNLAEPLVIQSLSIAIAIQLGPGTIGLVGYPV